MFLLKLHSSPDVCCVSSKLDFVNLKTFDFHGPWDKVVGHPAPLFPRRGERGAKAQLNVVSTHGPLPSASFLFPPLRAAANIGRDNGLCKGGVVFYFIIFDFDNS